MWPCDYDREAEMIFNFKQAYLKKGCVPLSPFSPFLLRIQKMLAAREHRVGWDFRAALLVPSVTEEETWA
jgi:hypothetical protein